MHNVRITGSTTQSAKSNDEITIIQNITWDAPLNNHNIHDYAIMYQMEDQNASNVTCTHNNATQATLTLLVPREKTSTYYVQVAAVSEGGQGKFSDKVDLIYSSK